jgi:hypothetical protein
MHVEASPQLLVSLSCIAPVFAEFKGGGTRTCRDGEEQSPKFAKNGKRSLGRLAADRSCPRPHSKHRHKQRGKKKKGYRLYNFPASVQDVSHPSLPLHSSASTYRAVSQSEIIRLDEQKATERCEYELYLFFELLFFFQNLQIGLSGILSLLQQLRLGKNSLPNMNLKKKKREREREKR